MISYLCGTLYKKDLGRVIVDVNGVGYEVNIAQSTFDKLPPVNHELKLFIVESVSMYGGGTTLYGFISEEIRDIYLLLKDNIPGAGAKKALDYLDKVSKSLPDFRKAIIHKDVSLLTGIFGFTKKTAEKVISSLKDKITEVQISGKEKWARSEASGFKSEAVAGLVALGYRETQARESVEKVIGADGKSIPVEEIIRQALRHL